MIRTCTSGEYVSAKAVVQGGACGHLPSYPEQQEEGDGKEEGVNVH